MEKEVDKTQNPAGSKAYGTYRPKEAYFSVPKPKEGKKPETVSILGLKLRMPRKARIDYYRG